ncbi:MAG: hypothetical protein L3J49_07145, partial [Desulfobulbaceae bacterium]|nr:hypothetical protein [Desulfobulbaceae bacterium]
TVPGKPACDMIWEHDEALLGDALDFYESVAQAFGTQDWQQIRERLDGGIDAALVGDVIEYVKVIDQIRRTMNLHCPGAGVDVADKATLKHRIRQHVDRDVLYAF